ncbi:MAG TPA: tRNA (guanosine(46)-N7)-methyltransferase TrmB [Gammaproteobacteria bacterium]|nr:tRNA (guanosine(46)-N7)-methyltransferase TrmB [Gammaproteobacteria bacterium]
MTNTPIRPPIKSFGRQQGRLTEGQRKALESLWEQHVLPNDLGLLDWRVIFGRPADTILEIGFGMGHSLITTAQNHPEINFLGIEVYRPGIGTLLTQLHNLHLTNVRVLCADAKVALADCVHDASLAGIHIFFPDPWPKKRHHKRRLIQPDFIELLTHKLKSGGYLHLATDWEDYAQHMLAVLSAANHLINAEDNGQLAISHPERPATKYEQRGIRLGHEVWDFKFYKQN